MGLAPDIGLRSLALVVERVELLLHAVFGGDAGVDGAAKIVLALLRFHRATPEPRRPGCGPPSPTARGSADRAASSGAPATGRRLIFGGSSREGRNPKKRWPFQVVPVI